MMEGDVIIERAPETLWEKISGIWWLFRHARPIMREAQRVADQSGVAQVSGFPPVDAEGMTRLIYLSEHASKEWQGFSAISLHIPARSNGKTEAV